MSEITFIKGQREDLPKKYHERMLKLLQSYDSERLPFEPPGIEYYRKYWKTPIPPEGRRLTLYAFKNDTLIGFGYSGWNVKYDNLDNGFFQVYVIPSERRKRYGTIIMKKMASLIPNPILSLRASAREGAVGELFLKKYGWKKSFEEIIRSAKLSDFNVEEIKQKVKDETNRIEKLGYKFINLEGFDYREKCDEKKYVEMVEQIWNDMPREELSIGEDVLTIKRYKDMIESSIKKGNRNFGVAIVQEKTNLAVGHTRVLHNKYDPNIIEQDDTGVIHEHRGNGFGLALKYKMLERILTETNAKQWITGNAESNVHMIRINEKLKHEIIGKIVVYEIKRKELEKI